jgi:hypothetical protein
MYEMQGTSPGLAASRSASHLAFPARTRRPPEPGTRVRLRSPCSSHVPELPRAVPVSNGESISTALARDRARPVPHLFPAFFLSTGCPQNIAGYPHSSVVFHRLLHRSSTGYQALRRRTLGCLRAVMHISMGFSNSISCFAGERMRLSDANRLAFPRLTSDHGRAASGRLPLHATMRMNRLGRHHCRRRARPGEGR